MDKLKGTRLMKFNLGSFVNKDGTLLMAPWQYIKRKNSNLDMLFVMNLRHLSIDLFEKMITLSYMEIHSMLMAHKCSSLLQWAVSLARYTYQMLSSLNYTAQKST